MLLIDQIFPKIYNYFCSDKSKSKAEVLIWGLLYSNWMAFFLFYFFLMAWIYIKNRKDQKCLWTHIPGHIRYSIQVTNLSSDPQLR